MKVTDTQLHFQWQLLNCLIATVKLRNFLTPTFLHGKGTGLIPALLKQQIPETDRRYMHTLVPAHMHVTGWLLLSLVGFCQDCLPAFR